MLFRNVESAYFILHLHVSRILRIEKSVCMVNNGFNSGVNNSFNDGFNSGYSKCKFGLGLALLFCSVLCSCSRSRF